MNFMINKRKIFSLAVFLTMIMASAFAPSFVVAVGDADYEPNDTWGTAAEITEGTHTGLYLEDSNDEDDYFSIDVPAERAISVKMLVEESEEYNDFYLSIENTDSSLEDSDSFTYYADPEDDENYGEVFLYFDAADTAYIHCEWDYFNSGNATYTLIIDIFNPIGDAKFEYGIAEDDQLVYTISNSMGFTASSDFYSTMEDYIVTGIEDQAGQTVFASDFDLENFTTNFLDFISDSVDAQLTVTDIYNIDYGQDISTDVMEGDVLVDVDGEYVLPPEYTIAKLNEFKTLIEPYLDADMYENLTDVIDEGITEMENADASDFEDLPFNTNAYFNNLSSYLDLGDMATLDNGTVFPALPSEHYFPLGDFLAPMYSLGTAMMSMTTGIFGSAKICYPTEYSFGDWYNFGMDTYDYMLAYADQEGENITESEYTFQELLGIMGVSTFYVDDTSIGISWSMNAADFNEIEDILNYTDGDLEGDFEEELQDMGIDYENSAAAFSFALEYDSDMVLASVAYYIDLTIVLDQQGLPTDLAILDDEILEISIGESMVRDGYVAPTKDQINDGEVGENRNLGGGFSLSNIPGYSFLFIGLISIVSTFAIIQRIYRRK